MDPYINKVIQLIQGCAPIDQQQKAFHALENYFLELKDQKRYRDEHVIFTSERPREAVPFEHFVSSYGYEPPQTQGSCGSSGGRNSNDMYGTGSIFKSEKGSAEAVSNAASGDMKCVTCPFCHEMVDAIVTSSKIECPECHTAVNK